jgi:lipid-A-disaccharide synthase
MGERLATAPSILVIAGEASADAHATKVIARLRRLYPSIDVFGIGGPQLRSQGLIGSVDTSALNVVGISEAVRNLGRIKRIFSSVLDEVDRRNPQAALLVDLPDFNLRLAKALKRRAIPVVYYIAPQAWAWRQGRVRTLRRFVDRLCVVFPFEEEFFARYQVPVEFVGHPLTEEPLPEVIADPNRVVLLPGSRPREIDRLLSPLVQAARLLQKEVPELRFYLPVAPGLDPDQIALRMSAEDVKVQLLTGGAGDALAGARLALTKSGTATVEAALAGVPMVVVYKLSRVSHALLRPMVNVSQVCMVNILAGRTVVPELLQGAVRPELIAKRALSLLTDGPERKRVLDDLRAVANSLGTGQPSQRVAEILATYLEPTSNRSVAVGYRGPS